MSKWKRLAESDTESDTVCDWDHPLRSDASSTVGLIW